LVSSAFISVFTVRSFFFMQHHSHPFLPVSQPDLQ
jgi:hypothetical protein